MVPALPLPSTASKLISSLDTSSILSIALFRRAQNISASPDKNSASFPLLLSSITSTTTALHTVLQDLRTEAASERNPLYTTPGTVETLSTTVTTCISSLSSLNDLLEKHQKGFVSSEEASVASSPIISRLEKSKSQLSATLSAVQRKATRRTLPSRSRSQDAADDKMLRDIQRHIEQVGSRVVKREKEENVMEVLRRECVEVGLSGRVFDENTSSLRSLTRSLSTTDRPERNARPKSLNLSTLSIASAAAATGASASTAFLRSPLTPTHRARSASVSASPFVPPSSSAPSSTGATAGSSSSSASASMGNLASSSSIVLPTRTRSRASSMRVATHSLTAGDFSYITTTDLLHLATLSSASANSSSLPPRSSAPAISSKNSLPIGPDQFGNPIAPMALWTKVNRDKFTAEAFRSSKKHFEAFPEFIAVLGFIGEEELLSLVEASNRIRQERARYAVPRERTRELRERNREYHHDSLRRNSRDYDIADEERRRRRRSDIISDSYDPKASSLSLTPLSRPRTSSTSLSRSQSQYSRPRGSSVSLALPFSSSSASSSPPRHKSHQSQSSSPAPTPATPRSPTRPKSILKNANPHDVIYDPELNPREVPSSSSSSPKAKGVLELATPRASSSSSRPGTLDYERDSDSDRDRRRRSRRSDSYSESDSASDASRERRGKKYYTVSSGDGNTPPSARNSLTALARYDDAPRRLTGSLAVVPTGISASSSRRREDDYDYERERELRHREREHRERDSREREYREGREHRKEKRGSLMSVLRDALH